MFEKKEKRRRKKKGKKGKEKKKEKKNSETVGETKIVKPASVDKEVTQLRGCQNWGGETTHI